MAGDISVISRPMARMTPTWGGVMPRSFTTCCAVRASPSRIHDPCFQIRPGCCAWNPILMACASGFGGACLDAAARLEVKQAFYRDLAQGVTSDQVIIVENEDPDASLRTGIV